MRRGFSILVDTTVCLKASRDLLRRDHICQRAFLRFFFQIQLSRLARVPPMLVHAARALSRSSLLPRESRGLFFSSRSIVRPTRRFVPFLFFLPFFFFFPFSSFLFSLFLFVRSSGAQFECIMPDETMAQRSCRAHAPSRISQGTAGANFTSIFTVSVVEKSLETPGIWCWKLHVFFVSAINVSDHFCSLVG